MRQAARALWRHAAFVGILVVVILPGTTSASLAPAPPPVLEPAELTPDEALPFEPVVEPLVEVTSEAAYISPTSLEREIDEARLAELLSATMPPSVFMDAQVVSIYGYPGFCVMGELGCYAPADSVTSALEHAAMYQAVHDELGTGRTVRPAFHLIIDVAQASPGADGAYLTRMPLDEIAVWVELARDHDLLIFLDIQVGWTTVMSGVDRLEPFLVEPFVHLAIDPEFMTEERGVAPGRVIGSLGAPDVNEVQAYLAGLVREHTLPPKVLVLHQFLPGMLTNTEDYDDVIEVEIVVDMDGFGPPADKIGGYQRYALADYSQRPGFKLFHHWDVPLMTPEDVMSLSTPPDYVIYQ